LLPQHATVPSERTAHVVRFAELMDTAPASGLPGPCPETQAAAVEPRVKSAALALQRASGPIDESDPFVIPCIIQDRGRHPGRWAVSTSLHRHVPMSVGMPDLHVSPWQQFGLRTVHVADETPQLDTHVPADPQ
jgi:hypothetical protein